VAACCVGDACAAAGAGCAAGGEEGREEGGDVACVVGAAGVAVAAERGGGDRDVVAECGERGSREVVVETVGVARSDEWGEREGAGKRGAEEAAV